MVPLLTSWHPSLTSCTHLPKYLSVYIPQQWEEGRGEGEKHKERERKALCCMLSYKINKEMEEVIYRHIW